MKNLQKRERRGVGAGRLAWLVFLAPLAVVDGACSHDIQSPLPKLDSQAVEPDLVCNAKPVSADFSSVTVHGQAFTPMPSKTLEDKPQLILPKITLSGTSLSGEAIKAFDIQDDPAKPAESRVHWISSKTMRFDVKPEDMFATGVFTITVTNPDGESKTTVEQALAVLPPPIVSALQPPAICDDQADQQVVIEGANFLVFDDKVPSVKVGDKEYVPVVDPASCTPIDGNFVEQGVKLCTSMTITIPVGDFVVTMETKVPVVVTNPAPADCQSSELIELTIHPPPQVDSVLPSTVCEGGSQLTVNGKNFQQGATVSLDCGAGSSTTASSSNVNTDGTQIGATFGPGATAGSTCDVVVQNPDGCQDRPLPHKQVTVVTGPILFYADPPVVYNGINTRVTLFATTITPPLPTDAVTMVPHGMSMPVTQLSFNTVANHPNRLQAIVPASTPAGAYDITLKDSSGCFATLPNAITVTADLTVTIKTVTPPFGWTNADTAVTIFRDTMAAAPADKPFVATPRVFLNPTNPGPTDVAVEMIGVSFVDTNKATGVVPRGTPVHAYDVVLVNPDGSVGLLNNGYNEVANPPPVVLTATPSSIVAATGQNVTLGGTNFDAAASVSVSCASGQTPSVTSAMPTCNGSNCTMDIVIDGSVLAAGDVCIVRVTNSDGTYGEYSAIGVTNSSLNLSNPTAGPDMNVGRRALVAAAGNATTAARFVYAIGGDDGAMTPTAFDTTEFAPVDVYGNIGAWTLQGTTLNAPRTLAGATTVGRYIYVVGGDNGAGPVATAERALILSPRETPVIQDVDLALGMNGLAEGRWQYRVSAIFAANDTDNPGGESLASDPFTIKLPAFQGKKISITLVWKAPVDSLDQPLQGVAGYRIYRTANADDPSGSEVLLATVTDPTQLTFTDDGTATPGTANPLPIGSTGAWAQLPVMATPRSGLAVAAGFDPAKPDTFYVYALLGKNGATTATATYEYLPVTIAPNGRQTMGSAWIAGTSSASVARHQIGAWVVDQTVQSNYAPDTWIFVGGGRLGNNSTTGTFDAGKIGAGGDLGTLSTAPPDGFTVDHAGYGVCAANQQLFLFGGQGGSPTKGAKSSALFSNNKPNQPAPPPTNANWNDQGLAMTHGRYLMGSAVQSSFIFLLGGQTDEPSAASKTTEFLVW